MLGTITYQNIYNILGICLIPIFFISSIYTIRFIIEKKKNVDSLKHIKKKLVETIDNKESHNEVKGHIEKAINLIQQDIYTIRQKIHVLQEKSENEIRGDKNDFYKKESNIRKNILQEKIHKGLYSDEEMLHREQVRIMNQNIHKFLLVYREKDKIIEEKNKIIDKLDNKISKIEMDVVNIHNNDEEEKKIRERKIIDIDKKIQREKTNIGIVMTMYSLIMLLSVGGLIIMYAYNVQKEILQDMLIHII